MAHPLRSSSSGLNLRSSSSYLINTSAPSSPSLNKRASQGVGGSSKAEEVLSTCRDKNQQLLAFFFHERIKSEDVMELVHASQKVELILAKMAQLKLFQEIEENSLTLKI